MVECTVAIGVTRVRFPTGVFFFLISEFNASPQELTGHTLEDGSL